MLKEGNYAFVDGCLVNESRLEKLESRIKKLEDMLSATPDVVETIKALAKGTFKGTSDLLSDVADCKHEHDKRIDQIETLVTLMFKRIFKEIKDGYQSDD